MPTCVDQYLTQISIIYIIYIQKILDNVEIALINHLLCTQGIFYQQTDEQVGWICAYIFITKQKLMKPNPANQIVLPKQFIFYRPIQYFTALENNTTG